MFKKILFVSCYFSLIACFNKAMVNKEQLVSQVATSEVNNQENSKADTFKQVEIDTSIHKETLGLLYHTMEDAFMIIENLDGSIYTKTWLDDHVHNGNVAIPEDFNPYFMYLDDGVLYIEVDHIDDSYYYVKINDNDIKRISRSTTIFEFETWVAYISTLSSRFSFDIVQNPIRISPSENAQLIERQLTQQETEDGNQSIEKIEGAWAKIKIEFLDVPEFEFVDGKQVFINNDPIEGWIKWTDGKNILIAVNPLD